MVGLFKELTFRVAKIFDIGYLTVLYFLTGIYMAKTFDNYFGKFDEKLEKSKSILQRTLELIGLMWLFGVVIYIVKNIIELVPSPFNMLGDFDHLKLKELKNAAVFTFIFLYFQTNFRTKIQTYFVDIKI